MGRDESVGIIVRPGISPSIGEMPIGTVQPVGFDLRGDRAVGRTRFACRATHLHDAASRVGGKVRTGRKRDVLGAPVDAIHDEVAPILQLVHQTLGSDAADHASGRRLGGIKHLQRPLTPPIARCKVRMMSRRSPMARSVGSASNDRVQRPGTCASASPSRSSFCSRPTSGSAR